MVPRRLKRFLPEDVVATVSTVRERGWGSKKNGDLLEAAQHEFDVLLTTDRGIPHQQNLSRYDIAVVILKLEATPSTILRRWRKGWARRCYPRRVGKRSTSGSSVSRNISAWFVPNSSGGGVFIYNLARLIFRLRVCGWY